MDILEKMVKRFKEEDGSSQKEYEYLAIGDIIDPDRDGWYVNNMYVLKHAGIQKLATWMRADWTETEVVDKPTRENDRGYAVKATCTFPDGSVSKRLGSANDKNTFDKNNPNNRIANNYKLEIAEKRAMDRSFLRSQYVGLPEVYSEEESHTFANQHVDDLKNQNAAMKNTLEREKKMLYAMKDYIPIKDDTSDFYNRLIVDIPKEDGGIDYLEALVKNEEVDRVHRLVARMVLKEWKEKEEIAEKEEEKNES